MSYTVFAVVAALVLLWHSSVAFDDRKNSLGNRKPSALADDVYEALVNLAAGKSLPPVALRKYAQQKKIGNDIPDKLLNSESKHRKR